MFRGVHGFAAWLLEVGVWNREWRQEVIRMPKKYIEREAQRGIGVMNWISAGAGCGMQLYQEEEKRNICCIDVLAPGGGFILSPGCVLPADTPERNMKAMVDAAMKYGVYNV